MNNTDINIRLLRIRELPRLNTISRWEFIRYTGSPVKVTINAQWHTATPAHEIALIAGARYTTTRNMVDRTLLDYNIELTFSTSGNDSWLYADDDRSLSLPPGLATVMLSVGIGSLRGMIASRTADSMLSRYPLPIINVSEIISRMAYGTTADENTLPLTGFVYE